MATRSGHQKSAMPPENRVNTCENWRRHPDSNRGIRVLQTLALPLGYAASNNLWGGEL